MLDQRLILVLATVLLMATSSSHADTQESPILSTQLAEAVGRQLSVDGVVFTQDELASVTELRIENTPYLDLTEIETLSQLKKLVLPGNYISDLAPLKPLNILTRLQVLHADNNHLRTLASRSVLSKETSS